jgi:hypothetical protein
VRPGAKIKGDWDMKKTWGVAAVLAAALLVAAAVAAFGAFAGGSTHRAAASAARNPNAVGVKVHGQWKLQVRQPNGHVMRTYRFHNDLYPSFGAGRISQMLLGNTTPGSWQIYLFGPPSSMPCSQFGSPSGCSIVKSGWSGVGKAFDNLVQTPIADGLRLRGTAIADNTGQISNVWTYLAGCSASVAPGDCAPGNTNSTTVVTQRVLPTAVNLTAGQQVLVTVDLTFS